MRVLGVDPGLSRCGIAVIDGDGHRATVVRAGVVRTSPSAPTAARLLRLHREVRSLIAETAPAAMAIERVFFNANVRTAMGVGQCAGVMLLAAGEEGIEVAEYTPTQVKSAVAGRGDADKAQVGFMVRALFSLDEVPRPPDVADALAVALCHVRQGALGRVGSATMSPRLAAALEQAGPGAQVTVPRARS